jgi:hypothetical protein
LNVGAVMIDVKQVLSAVPRLETFCSVAKLNALVDALGTGSPDFMVEVAGSSADGVPIYHIRHGKGAIKAMVVGGPHCPEQIGSATIFSLLTLLRERLPALCAVDVEWHIVPCLDPDGALLNEGWTQKPFTLESYMRNYYEQPSRGQVDRTFPIAYKKLFFDRPTPEALVLKTLLDRIRPDFFYTLHNFSPAGGVWYAVSRGLDPKYYSALYQLAREYDIPFRAKGPASRLFPQLADGVTEWPDVRKIYDYHERIGASPERALEGGQGSAPYLMQIKPDALTFCTELIHVRHPSTLSQQPTGENLRQLKMRIDADNKFLATAILEEWDKLDQELDATSPFYEKIFEQLVAVRNNLNEGVFAWNYERANDILFHPAYAKSASEGERFNAYMHEKYKFLCNAHVFVRLLRASKPTSAILQALERMEYLFDQAWRELTTQVDFAAFEVIDCQTLARVQLGSGLIALNSVLEEYRRVTKQA